MSSLAAFVDALPKVELHVHLEGGVDPETLLALARRHRLTGLPATVEELRAFYRFRDFDHFVEIYYAICANLLEEEDFALIAREFGTTLAAQGVRYAEVTFTPFNHLRRGIPAEMVFEGVERGRLEAEQETGIQMRWCTDVPGEYGAEAAEQTVDLVLKHRPEGVISFGLGGPEVGVPREQFSRAFDMARDGGLHSVPHAGETDGPHSIRAALDHLGAERIGHGVRCLDDADLVAELRDRQVPLEVCPTSNVCLSVAPSLAEHPLPRMLAEGLFITLNSDDPPMFNTSLRKEYLAAVRDIGLAPAQLQELARAAVRASFMDPDDKTSLLAEIDAVPLPE